MRPKYSEDVTLTGVRFVRLTVPSAVGAAYMGMGIHKETPAYPLDIDYSLNVETVYETKLNQDHHSQLN